MYYFDLFEIPVSIYPDEALLARKMISLQKKYHPDFYANCTDEERADALQKSSQINQAYKVLSHRDRIVHYILDSHNLVEEGEKYKLPPDFLMEIMDINEIKMDDPGSEEWRLKSEALLQELDEEIEPVLRSFDGSPASEKDLIEIKNWYYKKKYLYRLLA